jgi:hypothetical protein
MINDNLSPPVSPVNDKLAKPILPITAPQMFGIKVQPQTDTDETQIGWAKAVAVCKDLATAPVQR